MHFGLDTSSKLQVIFAIVTKKGNNRPKSVKFFIEFMHIGLEASPKLQVIFAVVTKKRTQIGQNVSNFSFEKNSSKLSAVCVAH